MCQTSALCTTCTGQNGNARLRASPRCFVRFQQKPPIHDCFRTMPPMIISFSS